MPQSKKKKPDERGRKTSLYFSTETDRQIAFLSELWGENLGATVARAVQQAHEREVKRGK